MSSETANAAFTTPVTQLVDTEAQIDMGRLRAYRLNRVREQLAARDYAACVLFDPINIRYATGFRNYAIWHMHIPIVYLFIPAEGPVVLFEGTQAQFLVEGLETIDECRSAIPLNFFSAGPRVGELVPRFADQIAALLVEQGGDNKRLALDRTDPRVPAALETRGVQVFDAMEPLETARVIKSREEILCMNSSIAVAEVAIARIHEALRPGLTETELWSILHQTNAAMGGEWIETRLMSSGDRANPWRREASARIIRPGELVGFDTDMIGPFGYCADISRTFRCGPGKPTAAQRELYQLAHEEIQYNMALVRPGLGFREFTEQAWKPPSQYVAHRYDVLAHGVGMCDEYPAIYYPPDYEAHGYDGVLEQNMVLSIESFMGAEGGHEGVKLEQMVLVTESACELLSRYPFEESFL